MHLAALDTFIALVELDAQVVRYNNEQKQLAKKIQTISDQIRQIASELKHQETVIHSLKKNIDSSDLDLKSIDDQLTQKKIKLNNAANPKEFFSLEQEVQALTTQKNKTEEVLFKLWSDLEAEQERSQKNSPIQNAQKILLQNNVNELEAQRSHMEKRVEQLIIERPTLVKIVPQDVLQQYDSMLESIDNPVVPIVKDACAGCFYSLTAQDLQQARKDQLVRCKECHRMLYALEEVRKS